MGGYAWVTLATNNSYSLGALVLAHSLKKSNTAHKLAVLITPAVSESMREQLQTVFDVVKVVDVLDSKDEAHLALMKRPDLGITFTKIHCWRLVEFDKCVFLDADTLVVRNCDELFEREEFSAAPDVSWPDCFNSGVFVYRPSVETFNKLLQFAVENRSFDGGDQGLLNQFFSDWATEDIKKHLPFVYNLTSIAAYSYIPAFKHYGSETRIVHFIGTGKPWLQQLDAATRTVTPTSGSEHLAPLLQQWWDLFCEKVHPNLDKNLESNNDGMPQPPVDACSNSVAIALTDEPQTARLTEPCTPYREKDDFRQYNLPYQPFDVKGSSGELLNVEFLLASVEEAAAEEGADKQREGDKMEEVTQSDWRGEEEGRNEEMEGGGGGGGATEEQNAFEEANKADDVKKVEEPDQNQQEEPPPPKDPFDYNSFFPDETCINNYLEQNVVTYQPFENHHQEAKNEREPEQEVPSLPRFLTIPENDRRQSGNVEANAQEERSPPKSDPTPEQRDPPPVQRNPPPLQQDQPPREPTPPREEPVVEKRELAKSKSMSHLPRVVMATEAPPQRSIWKSQPNLSVDPNRRYSMPKLKPILPKQNSFSKSVPSAMPKVTLYTEFLMSSEYKDPVDLPKDKVGFVESYIHREARLRRCKSDADIRSKFGPLPYPLSPEVEKPVIPKKFPPRHLDNELYDLAQCKRQMGNKPKPKDSERRENVRMLPALRPIAPAKDKKSTLIKKRKSKELSPGDGGREKIPKREPKIARERRRESKITPRNVSTTANGKSLEEILEKLREFSKDYQHFFGVAPVSKEKTVKCKNAAVQAGEEDGGKCKTSEAFETICTSVSTRSKETQTAKEGKQDGVEFRQFRNYVKDKRETSQMGLLGIQDILLDQSGTESNVGAKLDNRVVRSETPTGQREDDPPTQETPAAQKEDVPPVPEVPTAQKMDDNPTEEAPTAQMMDDNPTKEAPTAQKVDDNPTKEAPTAREDDTTVEEATTVQKKDETPIKSAILAEKEDEPSTREDSKCQTPFEDGRTDSKQVKPIVEGEAEETNIPSLEDNNSTTESKSPSEVPSQEGETTFLRSHSKPEHSIPPTAEPHPENVTESVDRPEIAHSRDVIQDGNKTNDSVDSSELSTRDLPNSDENNEEGSEHSGKFGCDYPPPVEGRNPEHYSATGLITPNEPKPDEANRNGCSCETVEEYFTASTVPDVSSPVINQNGHIAEEAAKDPQQRKKEKLTNGVDRPKNPNEILCVPDFETPRSSRVTLPTPKITAENVVEEGNRKSTTAPHRNGHANGLDSPEETVRIVGKKKSGRKSSPPSPSPSTTPPCGNPQNGSSEDLDSGSGIAGAIAQLSLDAGAQTPESAAASAAHQEYLRRQNWETGNMDYMGRDSFVNIWSKICQTLEAKEAEEEAAGGSPKQTTEEEKKPEAIPPAEDPVNLSTILQKCPEYIETLPGDPAAGPVEDDEIIFSKPENRQSCLTNISEDDEARTESSDTAGKVKLSDILKPETAVGGNSEKTPDAAGDKKVEAAAEVKAEVPAAGPVDVKPQQAEGVKEEKVQTPTTPAGDQVQPPPTPKAEQVPPPKTPTVEKVQVPATPAEEKSQTPGTPAADQVQPPITPTVEKVQPPTATPTGEKAQAETVPAEGKPTVTPTQQQAPPLPGTPTQPQAPPPSGTPAQPQAPPTPGTPTQPQAPPPPVTPTQPQGPPPATSAGEKAQPPTTTEVGKAQPPVTPTTEPALPPATPAGEKVQPPTTPEGGKPQPSMTPTAEQVQPPATPAGEKSQAPGTPAADQVQPPITPTAEKVQPPATSTGEKAQSQTVPTEPAQSEKPECKTVAIPPPSPTAQSSPGGQPEPEKKATECTTVAIPSPPIIFPGVPFADKGKGKKPENKPEIQSEPIPLPPPESPTLAPTQEPTAKTSDSSKEEGKQKKGVFTKILEMVGVAPKDKSDTETPKSVFYDVQGGAEEAKEVEQASEVKATPETKSDHEEKPAEAEKAKVPPPKVEEPKSEKAEEQKSKKAEEQKTLPPGKPEPGQAPMPKPARGPQEGKKSKGAIQASPVRKSPSPKLKMPQKPPETAVTTPTPPPQSEMPPRKNSALLKVDETILETPPVTDVAEAVKGKVDDIIGKAKNEVESLLQDRRSAEKEGEEGGDLINTMKLMMGAEEPGRAAAEEVEELKVTSEEERKRHKGEVVSSKLSDQILKAIPPPRRKAISEASASTSSIPKAAPAPEQKTPPGEGKSKSSKGSSIPVPPPRNKGKPTQPSPPKGKGKK